MALGVATPKSMATVTTLGVCNVSLNGAVTAGVPSGLFRIAAYVRLSGSSFATSRQRLAALLWPKAEPNNASANLRQILARIRRFQEEHGFRFVESNFSLVYLNLDDVQFDLHEFLLTLESDDEAMIVQACDLYTGDLLSDISASSAEFEDWLSAERDMLRNLYIDRIVGALNGDTDLSAGSRGYCARKLLSVDPYNEQAFRILMIEAADNGDFARLRQIYERCEHRLMSELGVSSSSHTKSLYSQLTARGPG